MRAEYKALEQNVIDLIKEEQAKLGYRREDIRLYYPMSSLEHLLGISKKQVSEKSEDPIRRQVPEKFEDSTREQVPEKSETMEKADIDIVRKCLCDFGEETKPHLGGVKISNKGDRFCFHIPEEGVEYVHEHMEENEFIKELVELVGRHGCTVEQIKALFQKTSSHISIEETKNGEFDWLICFTDGNPDYYYYCFKDEGGHMIYHRFLPADYEDLGF